MATVVPVVLGASTHEPAGLGVGRYLLGCLAVAAVLVVLVRAAVAVRRVVVPWHGAPARLVEATIGISLVTAVAFVLGGVRLFAGWPLLVGFVVVGVVVERAATSTGPRSFVVEDAPTVPSGTVERVVAVLALALVGAQWVSHTAGALGHGMTEGDTLWYHGVFAARFVQEGRLDILPDLGNALQGFFPANSQMFHAIAFFPFDRDLLSPLLNLLLATVAVLAAYCMGRRRGLGAMCVAASALVLGLPGLVGTHPGQATNDVLCATFLLLAVALLVEGGIEPVPLALAGAASALSLGTKLTVAVPIAVLTVAVVVVAFRRRRVALVLAWLLPLGALGAFWFVRNWVLVDNPLPFYDLRLGPLHLPQRMHLDDDASVAEHLFDGHVWSSVFRPGLRQAFGPVWPLVVAAPGAAGLLVVGRRRTTAERLAGLVAVAAGLGYVLMPFTMELGGAVFAATARYAAPALLVGAVLLPGALWADRWHPVARAVAAVVIIGVVVADALVENVDRFAPWWEPDRLNAIVIVAVALALVAVARRGGLTGRWVVGPLVVVVVVLGGVAVQRHYLERRYAAGAGLALDHADEYVSAAPPARVAPFSTIQFYPLFGPSFANRVLVLTPPIEDPPPDPATRCREWERALRTRRVDLVVDGDAVSFVERPDRSWFRDPSLRPVAHDGASVVYRARGPVHLACPVG